jgi:hypothetical protein
VREVWEIQRGYHYHELGCRPEPSAVANSLTRENELWRAIAESQSAQPTWFSTHTPRDPCRTPRPSIEAERSREAQWCGGVAPSFAHRGVSHRPAARPPFFRSNNPTGREAPILILPDCLPTHRASSQPPTHFPRRSRRDLVLVVEDDGLTDAAHSSVKLEHCAVWHPGPLNSEYPPSLTDSWDTDLSGPPIQWLIRARCTRLGRAGRKWKWAEKNRVDPGAYFSFFSFYFLFCFPFIFLFLNS